MRRLILTIILTALCAGAWAQYAGPNKGYRLKRADGTTTATVVAAAGGGLTTHTLPAASGTLAHTDDVWTTASILNNSVSNAKLAGGPAKTLIGRRYTGTPTNLTLGSSMDISDGGALNTIQGIRTTDTPSFKELYLDANSNGNKYNMFRVYNTNAGSATRAGVDLKANTIESVVVVCNAADGSNPSQMLITHVPNAQMRLGVNNTPQLFIASTGIGVFSSGPDRHLDVLDASNPQLRLTQTDGVNFTDFQVDDTGDMTVTPSDNNIIFDGDVIVTGYFTSGSSDPPSIAFYDNTRAGVLADCRDGIPPSKQHCMVRFFNSDVFEWENFRPDTGIFYREDGDGKMIEIARVEDGRPCYATNVVASYKLNRRTGEVDRVERIVRDKTRYSLKATAVMDPIDGKFYDRATSTPLTATEAVERRSATVSPVER